MSIYITKDGEKRKVNISATDVQLLDVDGKFKSNNLEDALKEVGSGTEENMTRIEEKVSEHTEQLKDLANPSILINGDFRKPINQRGKTVYDTTGYSIDRWVLWNANTTLTLNNGYCTLAGDYNVLAQHIEFPTRYSNKEVTLSAKVKGGGGIRISIFSQEFNRWLATEVIDTTEWKEISVSCTIGTLTDDSKRLSVTVEGAGADSIDIKWVKLEYGSVTTPFIPRLYGEELALCQRYYEITDADTQFRGSRTAPDIFTFTYRYSVPKRVGATVQFSHGGLNDVLHIYSDGTAKQLPCTIQKSIDKEVKWIMNTTTGNFFFGQGASAFGGIIADAEIY